MSIEPPSSRAQLLERAENISGKTVLEVASEIGEVVPKNLRKHKGWLGQLLEKALGADAKSKAEPDFSKLHIELKTIPMNTDYRACESTYVCTVPLLSLNGVTFEQSWVCRKLSTVLWMPILTLKSVPLRDRQIGMPFLWSPSPEEHTLLRQDWQELTDMVCLGELEQITARLGRVLQIRPKAADSRSLCYGLNHEGERVLTQPRGFYLRANFTTKLIHQGLLGTVITSA